RDGIAEPILIGDEKIITEKMKSLGIKDPRIKIVNPLTSDKFHHYVEEFYRIRQRKGMTLKAAPTYVKRPIYFASMMVNAGDADALIGGITTHYPETLRPALQCIGIKEGGKIVSGLYIIIAKHEVYFFADTTVNVNPNAEELAEIAMQAADTVKEFDIEPRVAMLSYSNFGSSPAPETFKVKKAVEIVQGLRPDLMIDGEMQVEAAVVPHILENDFPFSKLKNGANVLIFPDLNSGNIAYKLMARIGEAAAIGPVLMGMKKPVHVVQRDASFEDILNMTAIAVVNAMDNKPLI
ncbi:MAG TPA: phosphate acyltransferase, partial [Ignavibacteriales bacterium]|nr:phosphate acyltransferase [Ignavibacteriales bacterium]